MNSRLYDVDVYHLRSVPVRNEFRYRAFTFCLDLDEIEELDRRLTLVGTGLLRLFRFQPSDFIFSEGQRMRPQELKARIQSYFQRQGVKTPVKRVELLANLKTFGHNFNPAAFYFCYSEENQPLGAVLEVTNTYREKKTYFLGPETWLNGAFQAVHPKLFYVSPFVGLQSSFKMRLAAPADELRLQIDSHQEGCLAVHARVEGKQVALTDWALLQRFLSSPLITLRILTRVHAQALKLFLRKVPYLRKSDQLELQNGGLR
jgi:DUF1365 family protein